MTRTNKITSDDPLVSIIIPNYNDGDTLPRAVSSALGQTLSKIEVIVVDDASNDDITAVLDEFSDDRLRVFEHERNEGGSGARNTGIENATGTYVAFLDADDEFYPEKIEKQVTVMESANSDVVATYTAVENVRRGKGVGFRRVLSRFLTTIGQGPPNPEYKSGGERLIKEVLLNRLSIGGCSTLLVEKETIDHMNGFDAKFRRHQDWEFVIRLVQQGKLQYINEVLVVKHDTGLPDPDEVAWAGRRFYTKFESRVRTLEKEGYDVIGTHDYQLSKMYFKKGRMKKGSKYLFGSNVRGLLPLLSLTKSAVFGCYTWFENLF